MRKNIYLRFLAHALLSPIHCRVSAQERHEEKHLPPVSGACASEPIHYRVSAQERHEEKHLPTVWGECASEPLHLRVSAHERHEEKTCTSGFWCSVFRVQIFSVPLEPKNKIQQTPWLLVANRTIPTERPLRPEK
jgi:hypothetical protein